MITLVGHVVFSLDIDLLVTANEFILAGDVFSSDGERKKKKRGGRHSQTVGHTLDWCKEESLMPFISLGSA